MWLFPKVGSDILRHPRSLLDASHQVLRRVAMRELLCQGFRQILFLMASILAIGASCAAQQPEGPQSDAPPPVAPRPAQEQPPGSGERITVPAGTRVGVVLQNGISTRSAKPGDSVSLQTSFPLTQSNRVLIPVRSYLRADLPESNRPPRLKRPGAPLLRPVPFILPNI